MVSKILKDIKFKRSNLKIGCCSHCEGCFDKFDRQRPNDVLEVIILGKQDVFFQYHIFSLKHLIAIIFTIKLRD